MSIWRRGLKGGKENVVVEGSRMGHYITGICERYLTRYFWEGRRGSGPLRAVKPIHICGISPQACGRNPNLGMNPTL